VLASTLIAVALSLAPGDGLGLAPTAEPPPAPGAAVPGTPAQPGTVPLLPASGVVGALGGAMMLLAGRRSGGRDPLVVFVAGHGNGSAEGTFADLVALMGLDPADARYFDYRWATGRDGATAASEDAPLDDTVDALNGYLAGVAGEGRPIHVVGFSKGGVALAELLARWDDAPALAVASVRGAVLLDPPMAAGLHGEIQSLGRFVGPIPDDGGYDPVQCRFGWLGCDDDREHLGAAAGVAVAVVRNPNAGITNFGAIPAGLRVYEAWDDGPDFVETLLTTPWALPARISQAHEAVLHDEGVAACITAEMRMPGTCDLPAAGRPPLPVLGEPPGTRGGVLRVNYVV